MARPMRIQQAGTWHHVTARGIERRVIFRADRDREHFLELLEKLARRFACNLSAYVLMDNHFHIFVQTREANLSRAVQWLTSAYAAWFNRRYERSGHLFQGRFKAVLVDPDEWGLNLSRYIHLNPVRVRRLGLDKSTRAADRQGLGSAAAAELVRERVERLRNFRWSSYRAYAGYAKAPAWLEHAWILRRGGPDASQQRRWYREYCEGAIRDGMEDSIWKGLVNSACLGTQQFWERVLSKDTATEQTAIRVTFEQVRGAVERVRGEPWADFAGRHGDWGRDLIMYILRERSGESFRSIAQTCGIKRPGTAVLAVRRFEARLRTDKGLRKLAKRVSNILNITHL